MRRPCGASTAIATGSYTRRKIAEKGPIVTLSNKNVTPRFEALIEAGMAEFTGEYVVIEHADRFEPHVVSAARKRLEDFGVALPKAL